MTEILLIRHGQSANNALPEPQRVCDPGLTDIGLAQAEHLATYLQAARPTQLYGSPFLRSLETLRPAAQATGLRPLIRADLFEQGGCYSGYPEIGLRPEPGMGSTELSQRYPGWELDERIGLDGWWQQSYEDFERARLRAQGVAEWLSRELSGQGGRHALVIHADFKFLLIEALLTREAQADDNDSSLPLYNTGISHLVWTGRGWSSVCINSVTHLPSEMVTY